jgi:hypothetical protein
MACGLSRVSLAVAAPARSTHRAATRPGLATMTVITPATSPVRVSTDNHSAGW